MALTSAEKKKKQEELNRQGKLYLQAKAKGDKRAMAAARATADKIRKEAGWSYDAKTGTTYEKVSPIQKKGTVVNSKENLAMAKAGANPVKAVQQAAKKSSILTNSPASKSSVQQAKKAADTAAKKKAAPSTNKVLELGRGPIKTDGLTKSSVQKAVDAKRASTLNQMILGRAQTQGTLPKTSMLAKDQMGPFSAIPVADALRNLTQGPLQMQKLNDALDDLRKSKRINEENMGAPEQALRAAALGTAGGIGSLYETAKASVGNEIALLLQNPTRDLSEIGKLYQEQYGDATMDMDSWAARVMQESGRMRELATDDMGTVGKFLTDAGIGLAQNAPGIALSALNPVAGAAYFGANTAGSKAYEVQVNGGSADEALTRGIISGLIEGTTERISLHHLFNLAGNGTGAKQALKNFLRQMGVEASEEGTSYALNYLADKAAKDPNATFSVQELLWNMAVGGFTGGVMGAASGRVGSISGGISTNVQKNSAPDGTPFAVSDILNRLRGQKEKTPYMRPDAGLQLPSTVADGVFLDSNITQDHAPVKAKNDKSTDPLLLNRLQLPDSMADDAFVDSSITQGEAESKPVSEALLWAMGKTLPNPVVQRNAYRAQIDAAFSGQMTKGEKITLGDTPDIVAKYGMQAPLTMTQTTARKIAYPPGYLGGKHNLGIPALKHLPEQLADPIAILKSKTEGDSVVVLTAWNDTQGNPVIIPVHFGKDGTLTVENAIPSAYGKRNLEALFGENGENILYTKNNKSIDQLLSSRLQLPNAMADDTLVAYSIAQESAENNQTGDILRRVTGQAKQDVPVKTGQATVIYHPYDGKVPQNRANTPREQPMEISQDAVDKAKQAKAQTSAVEKGKSKLKNMMLSVFRSMGGQRKVTMDSVIFEGEPYTVDLNTRLVSKVVSGQDTSPERLAVMYVLDDAVKSAQYVGSGRYGKDKAKAGSVIRYDYFENDLIIDGNPYIMTFDVEVQKGQNNFRTYRVINEINLTPTAAYVGPLPTASHVRKSGLSRENSIAQNGTADNPIPDVLRRVTGIRTDENGALVQGSWADGGIKPKLGSDVDVRPQNTLRASRSAVSASDVGRYIQSAMEGQVTGSLYTGKLGGNAARDVYAATGIDADGYAVKLTEQAVGDTMQKIVAGSEMTMSDLSHIGEMVLSAEQAERGGTVLRKDALGTQDLKQSRGAQGASLPTVRLIKNGENGGYVITMAIDRANRSGYILSLDTVAEAAQVAQTQTIMPVSTPQTSQSIQETAQTVVGENTQVQAGIAQNASDGSFRVGETVRALDRGNIGTVVQYYPESGLYDVNFRDSQTGSNETVTLSADMLEGMWTGERLKNPQTQAELTLMRNNQLDGLNSDSYDLTGVTEQEAWQWAERVHAKHEAQRAGQAANRATPSTVDAPMMEGGIVDRIVKVANDCEIERLALMRLRQEMQLTEADLVDAREYAAGRKMTRPGKITTEKAGEIMRYGEALKAYNMRMREVRDLQTQIKEQRRVTAEELIAASDKWHDTKHGKLLDIRTPERVIRYIMGDTPEAQAIIDAYFTPVHRHEAESIRWQNEQRNKLREITKGSTREESVYVHMYNRLQENPGDSALQKQAGDYLEAHKKKINMDRVRKMHDGMVELTRSFYDDINEAGLRNGEEALEFRQNYIPSLQAIEEGGWINRLLRGMGIETMADELPTSIAGKTEEFRPVRKWQQFRQQRRGTDTEFDAVKAMDQYITNAAHAIYHTDDIHNLRTLEEAIRYKHSTEGGQAELDAIRQNPELSIDERTAKREEVWERSTTAFPSFPTWLAQYTNNLAGKKSAADRKTEHGFGRGFYRAVSDIETKVASNMVGFNVSTAFTNFIPLAQGKGELRGTSMMRAMKEFLGEKMQGRTDYRDASTFLTNRQGADKVAKTAGDKLMDASGVLMGTVDEFTSNVLHRARVMDNVEVHNMRYEDAMAEADSWTAGLMGDRSLGAMPNIFNEKNFFIKAFTMFQLEVANQYGYLFEDLPHNAKARTTSKAKAVGYVAGALTQILAASLLYNDLAEEVTGRRPALDPVGIVNDFVGQLTGYSIPNSVDLVRSAMDGGISKDDFKVQKGSVEDAVTEAALATANQIPGLSMLAEGGRLPVTAAIPSPAKLGSGVMAGIRAIGGNPAEGDKKALSDAGSELSKLLTYLVMPTGGSQLKKTVTGARDVQAGGRYGLDFEDNRVLNYPLYTDDGNTARTLQALLFGSTATKPGREWIESDFTSGLDPEQTKTYDKVRQTGADQRTVYNLLRDLAGMSDSFDQRDYLFEFGNLSNEQKRAIDRGVIAGEGKPAGYADYDSMILSSEYSDDSKTSQAVRRLKDTYGIPVPISHRLIKNIQNMDNVNQTDDQNLLTSINQAQYLDNSQKDALALELIVNATESRAKGWTEDVKGKMDVREYAGYALKLAEVKQRYTGQDDADKKADADMRAYLKKEDLSEDARLALCDALSIDIVPENYSMLTNKNQIKQMGALEQSELPFDTYMRVWEMKKATNEDGTYKYKKDQVVNEMERMGLSKAQINAVCQSFGWAAPYKQTSSKKTSSGKKTSSNGSKSKSSSSSSTGNTLRRLTGLPKLPKIG